MGGLGSGGGRWWVGKKPTVEECLILDTAAFRRAGVLAAGSAGSGRVDWYWGTESRPYSSVRYVLDARNPANARVWLLYQTGGAENVQYTVRLVTTPCHFGGVRWWFVCPLAVNGRSCRRRVKKLYCRGQYFGCRDCHGLAYTSSQTSNKRVYAALKTGWPFQADPRRMALGELMQAMDAIIHRDRKLDRAFRRLGGEGVVVTVDTPQ